MTNIERLAADSNVLLSAISGRAASKVFKVATLIVVTTERNVEEVEEYIPYFATRYSLPDDLLVETLAALPVRVYASTEYQSQLAAASELLGTRDPDDIDLAALALTLGVPIWSNDKDFSDFPTGVFTTARLLTILGV